MAERVGFEPTDTCASLDFESSALNRAQPSLRRTETSKGERLVKPWGIEILGSKFISEIWKRIYDKKPAMQMQDGFLKVKI